MPLETKWFDAEKTVLITEIVGQWTLIELFESYQTTEETLPINHPIPKYFIIDLTKAVSMPIGILAHREKFNDYSDPDSVTIVIGAHEVIKLITNTMKRFGLVGEVYFVDTHKQATETIAKHRDSNSTHS